MTPKPSGWTVTQVAAAVGLLLTAIGVGWQVASFAINLRRDVDDLLKTQRFLHGDIRVPEGAQ